MNQNNPGHEQVIDNLAESFMVKAISDQPIESIVSRIPEAISDHQFSLLHTYIYHEIVESKGYPIQRKVYIYEICRAKTAAAMLTNYPHFSVFMPCRLAVYEENERTILATMNMAMMLNDIQNNTELYNETLSLFNTLKTIIGTLSNK